MSSTNTSGEDALQRECMRLQIRGHFGSAYAKRHPLLPSTSAALRPCSSGLASLAEAKQRLGAVRDLQAEVVDGTSRRRRVWARRLHGQSDGADAAAATAAAAAVVATERTPEAAAHSRAAAIPERAGEPAAGSASEQEQEATPEPRPESGECRPAAQRQLMRPKRAPRVAWAQPGSPTSICQSPAQVMDAAPVESGGSRPSPVFSSPDAPASSSAVRRSEQQSTPQQRRFADKPQQPPAAKVTMRVTLDQPPPWGLTLEVDEQRRFVVQAVTAGGVGERAGLKTGQILSTVNGKPAAMKLLRKKPPLCLALTMPPPVRALITGDQ